MCVHVTKIDVQFLAMCLLPIISHDYLFCLFFSHMCCLCTYACVRICVHSCVRVRLCVRACQVVCARVCTFPLCFQALLVCFLCYLNLVLLYKKAIISWVLISSGWSDWKNCCSRAVYCFWGFRSYPTLSRNERFKGDCGYKQRRRCTDISGDAIFFSLSVLLRI